MSESKEELNERLNMLLGIEPPVDFSKMKKEDLQRLWEVMSKLPSLIQVGARASLERVMTGPAVTTVRDFLNMPAMQRLRELRKHGGLVGLIEEKLKEKAGPLSAKDKKSS